MSESAKTVAPKESASVILVRGNPEDWGEVFLARRNRNLSFMAEAYVFPGGQVAKNDADARLDDFIAIPESFDPGALLQDENISPRMAQSFFICAIRETFEEAGVILARKAGGHSLKLHSPQMQARFAVHRKELDSGQITLWEIAQKENLQFALEALLPYAHWITPEILPKRFSTRFFLAELPECQETTTDCSELTDSFWAAPADILKRYFHKEILLMPPTIKILEELTAFASVDELFAEARGRTIYPILPEPANKILKLPHDPEYGIDQYKRPARPAEPSRLIFIDGLWQTRLYPK